MFIIQLGRKSSLYFTFKATKVYNSGTLMFEKVIKTFTPLSIYEIISFDSINAALQLHVDQDRIKEDKRRHMFKTMLTILL